MVSLVALFRIASHSFLKGVSISSDEAKSNGKLSFVRRDGFNSRQSKLRGIL